MSEEKEVSGEVIESGQQSEQTKADNKQQSGNQQQGQTAAEVEERNWAMACHLSGLASMIGVPLLNIIAPLIIWLIKRDGSEMIDYHGKESLNFQITMTIVGFVCMMSIFIGIGIILTPVAMLFWFVMTIVGGVKTSSGERYQYPLTIRFIK
ncbi:MAG: DUF4870 domain-containing protein [Cellvibrionaceae bacterium]|nr:DUF4870 domain-containing protein [Cellvibrionaceae bacterium]MCV6625148.1 DUF4870 domain-containing protein [Cellvibrionaceae bacterium]